MIKPELILPAGNPEKAMYALAYGADAVYAGLPGLSLRTKYIDFTERSLAETIERVHEEGRRFYVALNTYAHEPDLEAVRAFLVSVIPHRPDAFIVSDPGILRIIREMGIDTPLHLSTQASTTNSEALRFWRDQGVTRVILARELGFNELEKMCERSDGTELEIFVHGAMCVSYSGRCLLSNFLTGRNANRGGCAGSCRWRYSLVEETREGERFEIEEDPRGTYILNSKDLCLLSEIAALQSLPIHGYKVEGRTKNLFYVSLVARAYREVIDGVFDRREEAVPPRARWLVDLTDNHGFTTGFLFPEEGIMQNVHEGALRKQRVVGLIKEYGDREIRVSVKNPLTVGDTVVGIAPDEIRRIRILGMREKGSILKTAFGARKQEVVAEIDEPIAGSGWRWGILAKE
jgi:putative protease